MKKLISKICDYSQTSFPREAGIQSTGMLTENSLDARVPSTLRYAETSRGHDGRIVIKILLLLILSAVFCCCFAETANKLPIPRHTAATPLDRIVVVVNDDVITQHAVTDAMEQAKEQLISSKVALPPDKELRKQVINSLIFKAIMQQMIKRAGIEVSSEELNAAINHIAQQNHITLAQLKASIEQHDGSYAEFRQQLEQQLQIDQLLRQAIGPNVTVTEQEVTEFLHNYKGAGQAGTEYHLEDILLAIPDEPTPEQIAKVKAKANELMQQIRSGKDFSKLAVAHSSGAQALKAGDLGWRKLAELPTVFAGKVGTMKQGQVIGPVRAPNGFHILKLAGVRGGQKLTRDQVRDLIMQRKLNEKRQQWLKKMRDKAYVKFM